MLKRLSPLEQRVMDLIWSKGEVTSEDVRQHLHPLRDSTVRTLLRRLEEKGHVKHRLEGRSYVYSGAETPQRVGLQALRQIVNRFWNGSVEQLVAGMVDGRMVEPDELEALARKLAAEEKTRGTDGGAD